jgi:hypothetical protein
MSGIKGHNYTWSKSDSRGRRIPADEGHREMAARVEEWEIQKAEKGQLAPQRERFGRLPLTETAHAYLASRRLELAPSSMVKETDLAARLKGYFGVKRLSTIKTESVLAYREWRASKKVGPALINMEMGCLRRILKKARLWNMVGGRH